MEAVRAFSQLRGLSGLLWSVITPSARALVGDTQHSTSASEASEFLTNNDNTVVPDNADYIMLCKDVYIDICTAYNTHYPPWHVDTVIDIFISDLGSNHLAAPRARRAKSTLGSSDRRLRRP